MSRTLPVCCMALLAGWGDDPAGSSESQDLHECLLRKRLGRDGHPLSEHGDRSHENTAIDPTATSKVISPPFLIYEPQQDGSTKLVGVEYVKAAPQTDPAATLFDQQFTSTQARRLALHV